MGGSYGSIHFETTNRDRVLASLGELAASAKTRFLLGPEYGGWIAAYPEGNGQDESVSQSLAKALSLPTLHLIVHDDDIFAYFYYREGQLIDEYDSCPDYFGEVDAATRERKRGRPELLRDLLRPPGTIADLQEILTPPTGAHPLFVSESLERFAKVIGLTNAVTCYEYLTDGER